MRKFINIVNEATLPTKIKTARKDDLSSLMPQPQGGVPTINRLKNAGSERTATALANAHANIPADLRADISRVGVGNILRDLQGMGGTDHVSDAEARRLQGTTAATGVPPQQIAGPDQLALSAPQNALGLPATPENLPAIIGDMMHTHRDGVVDDRQLSTTVNSRDLEAGFDPEWHMVRDLPAYILNGVRQVARAVFVMWTKTPIEDVQMMCDLLNPKTDVMKMAAWVVNNGTKVKDCNLDFQTAMPSYAAIAGLAECTIWAAGGYQFLIMRDRGGHYIYSWPEADAVHDTPQLGGPTQGRLA